MNYCSHAKSVILIVLVSLITCVEVSAGEKPIADILSRRVVCKQPDRFCAWPSICKTADGQLLVVFSGDRDAHICPWGKTQMVSSNDNGRTWSGVTTINNTPLDDRDAGIIETAKGTLIVNWFTSLYYERIKDHPWQRHLEKIGPETRKQWVDSRFPDALEGYWIRRSTDGGKTWGNPIHSNLSTPHGPIQLRDGRLLYIGLRTHTGHRLVGVQESRDDGLTWQVISTMNIYPELPEKYFLDEPHMVELDDGKLVAMFRYGKSGKSGTFMWQSESTDGGRNWSEPHRTNVFGYPPHLIKLSNGHIVVVYGRRVEPYGIRACISRDGGQTWDTDNEIILDSALNSDLGYPASVQLDDGSIFTIYYKCDKNGKNSYIAGTHWRLNE